jgi:acetyl esterase/lipase
LSAAVLTPLCAEQVNSQGGPEGIPPDLADVSYGPHERNVFDLWKAKSDKPTPLVIHIHGGGFLRGDKHPLGRILLEPCLRNGISVASINYRYSTIAPYPAPMADGARAVQFLRLHAKEYNLNPKAFAATGGSAGSYISLWVGFHDDMADPVSDDPVKRQSTRLSCMAVFNGPATLDPRAVAKLIDEKTGRHPALAMLFGVPKGVDPFQAMEYFKLYEDGSVINHLTADDPPVMLVYSQSNTPMPPENATIGVHHPRLGYPLKEKMDKLGIECIFRVKEDYDGKPTGQRQLDFVDFFLKHFPK